MISKSLISPLLQSVIRSKDISTWPCVTVYSLGSLNLKGYWHYVYPVSLVWVLSAAIIRSKIPFVL